MVTVMFQNEPLSCFSIPKVLSHDFIRKPQIVDTRVYCFIRNNNTLKKKKILGDFNTWWSSVDKKFSGKKLWYQLHDKTYNIHVLWWKRNLLHALVVIFLFLTYEHVYKLSSSPINDICLSLWSWLKNNWWLLYWS